MAEETIKSAVNELTIGRIQDEVMDDMEKLLTEGFRFAEKNDFPAHSYFEKRYKEILERRGLIDAWLSFICFCIFSQGVSVGMGRKMIEKDDISKTQDEICDKWPDCLVMRLKSFNRALDYITKWFDKQ